MVWWWLVLAKKLEKTVYNVLLLTMDFYGENNFIDIIKILLPVQVIFNQFFSRSTVSYAWVLILRRKIDFQQWFLCMKIHIKDLIHLFFVTTQSKYYYWLLFILRCSKTVHCYYNRFWRDCFQGGGGQFRWNLNSEEQNKVFSSTKYSSKLKKFSQIFKIDEQKTNQTYSRRAKYRPTSPRQNLWFLWKISLTEWHIQNMY